MIVVELQQNKYLTTRNWGDVVDFEANGMLPGGLHEYSFEQFLQQFVDGFPTSQRRKEIATALCTFAKEIFTYGIPFEFWIDGSYVTTKINPNDADVVLFLQYSTLSKIYHVVNSIRAKYYPLLDVYFSCAASPENQQVLSPKDFLDVVNDRNYWRGQFGFDRADRSKGIVKIDCQSLSNYITGGDIDGAN